MTAKWAGQLSIELVAEARTRKDWLRVPYAVFEGDPAWIPPLPFLEKRRISETHNPFFRFGEAAFFVAYRGGTPIGRISSQINRRYLELYPERTGHFGFFDCIDDQEAARGLTDASADWLRARGMKRMEGPFNFSMHQEYGLLISGFDSSPACFMTHARPWMGALLEAAGFLKSLDTLAYRIQPARMPGQMLRLASLAKGMETISVRSLGTFSVSEETRLIVDIYNDALSDQWGFTPLHHDEIAGVVRLLRFFARGHYGRVVLLNGEPAGAMLIVPNVNELIAPFNGTLLPFNWARLFRDMWCGHFRTARIPLTALRRKYVKTPVATAMLTLLAAELWEPRWLGFDWIELSHISELNKPARAMAQLAAGHPVKTFRLYNKTLR